MIELIIFRFFPYWPVFAVSTAVMLLLAVIYLKTSPPIYEISARMLIKDENKGVDNPQMMESLDILTSKKIVENEIEVLKSRTLVREAVAKLNLCSPISEQKTLTALSAFTTCPVAIELKDYNRLVEVERVDFSYNENSGLIIIDKNTYDVDSWITLPYAELRFVKNPFLQKSGTGPFFFSLVDHRKIVNSLIRGLSVAPSNKLSTVINLSLKDEVPARGELILNTLMQSYDRASADDKSRLAQNTLEFIDERIRIVEHDLDSVEKSIERYKSSQGIVDLSTQSKVFLENVGDNDQKLAELNMQLAVLDRVESYAIQKTSSSRIVPSTLGIKDDRLSQLVQKLYEAEIEYERLRKTTAENNPLLISLANEIENIRPSILENIRNQKNSLNASLANLASTNSKYASILETIPQKERELLEVNRQHLIKNNVYTFLLQKREETALLAASSDGDSRLVDSAESSIKPVSPKKFFVLIASVFIAGIIGLLWVVLKEFLSNKILFRSEIEDFTKVPVVGEVSFTDLKDYLVIDNPQKPFLTDQFRQIRASLGLYGTSAKKVIMITSAISGEGKSFISANFAASLAKSNKKVLLVDMDIRNPRLSSVFNATGFSGVAELLTGETNFEQVIRKVNSSSLYIIPTGKKRANASELLLTGNIQTFIERLRGLFDFIIIDTAPIDPVTDGYIISPFCDATLFVVCHRKTPKGTLQMLDEHVKVKGLNNISIIFNGVRPRGLVKSAYGFGYGYGYNYVYYDRSKAPQKNISSRSLN